MIKIFFIILLWCLSCSWYGIAMEESGRYDDEVKRAWIPKADLALKLIGQSEKTQNSVRYSRYDDEGSFNVKLDRASIYVYSDPVKKRERVEVSYKIEEFKKLLKEPLPSPKQNDGPSGSRLEEKRNVLYVVVFFVVVVTRYEMMLTMQKFYVLMVVFTWYSLDVCMEEEPQRALSNSDIDEVKFYAHWRGYEEDALAVIRLKRIVKKKIKIKDPKRGKIGLFNPNDGEGSVTNFFVDGPLKLSYSAFVLRLKNNDTFEQKPLEHYQTLPRRNGVRVDNPPDQQLFTVYHHHADQVKTPETHEEEDPLIGKPQRTCWCCNLY